MKTKLLLLGFGGPRSPAEIVPFLANLFTDRNIIQFPFQSQLAPLLGRVRASRVRRHYECIGGHSPAASITEQQATLIGKRLQQLNPSWEVESFVAFSYTAPFIEEVVREMEEEKGALLIAFSQYPQFSFTTTGTLLKAFERTSKRLKDWVIIDRWFDSPAIVSPLVHSIEEELSKRHSLYSTALLFCAHSLPLKHLKKTGDLYPYEVGVTMNCILKELLPTKLPYQLGWQSRIGPQKWLSPSLFQAVDLMHAKGFTDLILVPLSFTTDNIEVLYELDVEMKEYASRKGIKLSRVQMPNANEPFVEASCELILGEISKRKHENSK